MTVLEMVLTFGIAMLVLLALFMLVSSQYNHAQAGREMLDDSAVARAVLTRIASDISGTLGPVDPRFLPKSIVPNNANQATGTGGGQAAAAAAAAATLSGQSSNTNQTGSMTNNATGSNSSSNNGSASSNSSSSTTPTLQAVPFNLGVRGDTNWMVLSTNRVPGGLLLGPNAQADVVSSDLRNVSYWMTDGGLARREMSAVTSDDAPMGAPDVNNASQYVIAQQVQDITFEYFAGAGTWQSTWDGTLLGGNDGNTPTGPPAAIRITITLKNAPLDDNGNPKQYSHIVQLPATNGFTQMVQSGQSQQPSSDSLIDVLQSGTLRPAANATSSQSGTSGTGSQSGSGM